MKAFPLLAISFLLSFADGPATKSSPAKVETDKPQINWISFEEAARLNQKDKRSKKVIIDMYTDWCGW